jgi:microcystin-dependent protein
MRAIGTNIPAGVTIASIDSTTQVTLSTGTGVTAGTANIRFAIVDGITLGSSGGEDVNKLTTAQMPLHGHPFRASYATAGSASSDTTGGFLTRTTSASSQAAYSGAVSNATGQQIGGEGGGQAHNNIQPTLVLNYIIKT